MRPAIDRIRERIAVVDGCWVFGGARVRNGYGVVNTEAGTRLTHRIMWEDANGPVPAGLDLDHLCRNRACVNPAHLEPVTRAENVRRGMWAPGIRRVTHCHLGHEYTPENSYVWRKQRYCRTCLKLQRPARNAQRRRWWREHRSPRREAA